MILPVSLHALPFFFNDAATTEIYTLSLHDALPIWSADGSWQHPLGTDRLGRDLLSRLFYRSEEHTSELQSHSDLVCRLLLEKKKRDVRESGNRRKSHHAHRDHYSC